MVPFFYLWQPSCSVEQNQFSSFGKSAQEEHVCKIILKLVHWPMRRCRLKIFFFQFFSSGCVFVHMNRTISASLVKGHTRNISEIILKLGTGLGGDVSIFFIYIYS